MGHRAPSVKMLTVFSKCEIGRWEYSVQITFNLQLQRKQKHQLALAVEKRETIKSWLRRCVEMPSFV